MIRFHIRPNVIPPGRIWNEYSDKNTTPFERLEKNSLLNEIRRNRYIYLMITPGLIFYLIFAYGPMPGLMLAFKKYIFADGIWGSPWTGFKNFHAVFTEPDFLRAFRNTILISAGKIIFVFPIPITLALLITEIRLVRFPKIIQTVYTFPHFLSWVVIAGIVINIFSSRGAINNLLVELGGSRKLFLADSGMFRPMLFFLDAWKEAGWSSIIYLAAISTIDQSLYESADIDGANRLQMAVHITIPSILYMITLLLILRVGQVMNAGFMQILNLYNPAVYDVGDIIDTYVYRITFHRAPDFGYSTAVGMFKAVLNFILVILADRVAKRFGQMGIF